MKVLKSVKCIFADLSYSVSGTDAKILIDSDTERYYKLHNMDNQSPVQRLNGSLMMWPSFRNVFVYRIFSSGKPASKLVVRIHRAIIKEPKTIEISGKIGKGFVISHNWSVIFPETTGDNFRVGPGVVIGRNGDAFPKIGNNVYCASNSTVVGDVVIGDNVIVGAGAVVVKNIPSNVVVAGNPARIIRNITDEDLLMVQ